MGSGGAWAGGGTGDVKSLTSSQRSPGPPPTWSPHMARGLRPGSCPLSPVCAAAQTLGRAPRPPEGHAWLPAQPLPRCASRTSPLQDSRDGPPRCRRRAVCSLRSGCRAWPLLAARGTARLSFTLESAECFKADSTFPLGWLVTLLEKSEGIISPLPPALEAPTLAL